MKRILKCRINVWLAVVVVLVAAGIFVYSGIYNIAADDPHTEPVFAALQLLRNRSIEVRSDNIKVPNLDDPQLILKGAGQYAAMCTGCHLAPGMEGSELRIGMYPRPPNLSEVYVKPKVAFWTIKHGVKMSGMPAWGMVSGHDDEVIWSLVAFLQKLPDMTPSEYQAVVAKAPADHAMQGGHQHGNGEAAGHHEAGSQEGHAHESHPHTEAGEPTDHSYAEALVGGN